MLAATQAIAKHEALLLEDESNWLGQRRDFYTYCAPWRDPKMRGSQEKGPRDADEIWDATPAVAAQRGASKIQRGIMPDYEDWIDLIPGPLVPRKERTPLKRKLADVTAILRALVTGGSCSIAAGELFADLFGGDAAMLILKGDKREPIKFITLPPEQVPVEYDSTGRARKWFFEQEIAGEEILERWPNAKLTPELTEAIRKDKTKKHWILMVCELDYLRDKKPFCLQIIDKARKKRIFDERLRTSCFITPRMYVTPGQRRGAGPPTLAMPTIKTLNTTVEFELKAAAFAILGAWITSDDGVYNPRTSVLSPGGMLKVSRTGGNFGASIERLPIPDNFDLSRLVLNDLRIQVREMLFDNELPDEAGSVRSPTEIVERLKRLVQHIAGVFGRLHAELIVPLVQRVLDLADQWGLLPEYVDVDGLLVKAQVISPLAHAQMLEDVEKVVRWVELMGVTMGPDEAKAQVDPDELGPYLHEKLGVADIVMRDEKDRKAFRARMQNIADEAYRGESEKAARAELAAQGKGAGRQKPAQQLQGNIAA